MQLIFGPRKIKKSLIFLAETILQLLGSVSIVWVVLAKLNYLYPFWLSRDGKMELITELAKRNKIYPDFACTTYDERVETFLQMKQAVHDSPQSIGILYFESSCNASQITYLSLSETLHLYEVSKLIDTLEILCPALFLGWLVCVAARHYLNGKAQNFRSKLYLVATLLLSGFAVVKFFGTKSIYNYFHTVAFPPNDKWAYSFDSSVMITMFAASNFFLFVCALLISLSIWVFMFLLLLESTVPAALRKMKILDTEINEKTE